MSIRSVLILAAAVTFASPLAVQAQDVTQNHATIKYSDLDLTTIDGVAALHRRIAHAADTVCDRPVDIRDQQELDRYHSCREAAIASSTSQVDAVVAMVQHGTSVAAVPHPIAPSTLQ